MQDQSPLLLLPAELRIKIYRYVLVESESPHLLSLQEVDRPSLLFTCLEIQLEAAPIYFSENHFSLSASRIRPSDGRFCSKPRPTSTWMEALGNPGRMRHVVIYTRLGLVRLKPEGIAKLRVLVNGASGSEGGNRYSRTAQRLQRYIDGVLRDQEGKHGYKGLEILALEYIYRSIDTPSLCADWRGE